MEASIAEPYRAIQAYRNHYSGAVLAYGFGEKRSRTTEDHQRCVEALGERSKSLCPRPRAKSRARIEYIGVRAGRFTFASSRASTGQAHRSHSSVLESRIRGDRGQG